MKFLDQVLKEAIRLYPPVSVIARKLDEDVYIDGHRFYKNTDIALCIFVLHRNQKYWKDPLKFNPYRFNNENYQKRDPYCYVPFSAGPRNCIGQRFALLEAKICVYYILKNFNLKSIQNESDIQVSVEIITRSRNGLMLQFTKRV